MVLFTTYWFVGALKYNTLLETNCLGARISAIANGRKRDVA